MKIKKDEWWAMAVATVIFSTLNMLMVIANFGILTKNTKGYWTLFSKNFHYSGFDPYAYITVSSGRPMYEHYRHPMLWMMEWPFYPLNDWLTQMYGINCAIIILAVVWAIIGIMTFGILYRVMRRGLHLTIAESYLSVLFLYSTAYVLLPSFVPDHMGITMLLLSIMLLLVTKAEETGKPMPRWQSWLMTFIATGVTTTNICKVFIADAITWWKRCTIKQAIRKWLLYIVPIAAIAVTFIILEATVEETERQHLAQMEAAQMKKDPEGVRKKKEERKKLEAERASKQLINTTSFKYTDTSISIPENLWYNWFGESIQLNDQYLLKDAFQGRPLFVKYQNPLNSIIEVIFIGIMLAGMWMGRKNRLLWTVGLWVLLDMTLHIIVGFASNEVYIMSAHWALIYPIAAGCLLYATRLRSVILHRCAFAIIGLVTAWLWYWNMSLILTHMNI